LERLLRRVPAAVRAPAAWRVVRRRGGWSAVVRHARRWCRSRGRRGPGSGRLLGSGRLWSSRLWSSLARLCLLRRRLLRRALLCDSALLLARRSGFFRLLRLLGLRLCLLRLLRHDRLPIVAEVSVRFDDATVTVPPRRSHPPARKHLSRRVLRGRAPPLPSRSARRCGPPGSPCPLRSASCNRHCRQRSHRA
jgi:hypothetical protein